MKEYILAYRQPYKYDHDSPSGIGDHGIDYVSKTFSFKAFSDLEAIGTMTKFMHEGAIEFGSHPGSPPAGTYQRLLVSLVEPMPDRAIPFR